MAFPSDAVDVTALYKDCIAELESCSIENCDQTTFGMLSNKHFCKSHHLVESFRYNTPGEKYTPPLSESDVGDVLDTCLSKAYLRDRKSVKLVYVVNKLMYYEVTLEDGSRRMLILQRSELDSSLVDDIQLTFGRMQLIQPEIIDADNQPLLTPRKFNEKLFEVRGLVLKPHYRAELVRSRCVNDELISDVFDMINNYHSKDYYINNIIPELVLSFPKKGLARGFMRVVNLACGAYANHEASAASAPAPRMPRARGGFVLKSMLSQKYSHDYAIKSLEYEMLMYTMFATWAACEGKLAKAEGRKPTSSTSACKHLVTCDAAFETNTSLINQVDLINKHNVKIAAAKKKIMAVLDVDAAEIATATELTRVNTFKKAIHKLA
jgi:hypothetical protein